jgi:hypothetical protein
MVGIPSFPGFSCPLLQQIDLQDEDEFEMGVSSVPP